MSLDDFRRYNMRTRSRTDIPCIGLQVIFSALNDLTETVVEPAFDIATTPPSEECVFHPVIVMQPTWKVSHAFVGGFQAAAKGASILPTTNLPFARMGLELPAPFNSTARIKIVLSMNRSVSTFEFAAPADRLSTLLGRMKHDVRLEPIERHFRYLFDINGDLSDLQIESYRSQTCR
ncbi:MAG: hypothetical protein HYY18_20365 [Planctomycetes bacterium]|nr:hypothetical protein [Planctomycetota bacterium]